MFQKNFDTLGKRDRIYGFDAKSLDDLTEVEKKVMEGRLLLKRKTGSAYV